MSPRKAAPPGLEPIETASRDEIAALQLERLQWTLRHAYDNVAHYRKAFDSAGVGPGDCRSLDDLAKFPFTTKAHLRDERGQRRLDVDGTAYAVEREAVGDSSLYALEVAVRVGKLLGIADADLARFLG